MTPPLADRTVLLVLGGGVAAYKGLETIRELRKRGARVVPVLTRGAQEFVTPLSAASLAGEAAHTDLFDLTSEAEMGHIQLSREADLIVIAPATADLMARMAAGHAADLASTLLLATDTRALLAPAMNVRMWQHPATKRNVETLRADGALFVGPEDGEMACGETGPGRMAEPAAIADAAVKALHSGSMKIPLDGGAPRTVTDSVVSLDGGAVPAPARSNPHGPLKGKRALVTSGPTHEPLDPVRYMANRSSGRQGHAIARGLAEAGALVTLVTGPVSLPAPAGVRVVNVTTAREMEAMVGDALEGARFDVAVFAAAVADWRVEERPIKMKKTQDEPPTLRLIPNPDVLAGVARRTEHRPALVIGFAAETDRVIENARAKLARKGADWILANDVSRDGPAEGVFGGASNAVHLVTHEGVEDWPLMSKEAVAERLAARIATRLMNESAQP